MVAVVSFVTSKVAGQGKCDQSAVECEDLLQHHDLLKSWSECEIQIASELASMLDQDQMEVMAEWRPALAALAGRGPVSMDGHTDVLESKTYWLKEMRERRPHGVCVVNLKKGGKDSVACHRDDQSSRLA